MQQSKLQPRPSSTVVWWSNGYAGIAFSFDQALELFASFGPELKMVACVEPPRSLYVRSCAEAKTFFNAEEKT